jgi:hypothetical protein
MIKRIFTVGVVVLTIFWAVGLAAFVPTAQAVTISSGDLIKASLPAVYYYGADGKRYVFPDQKTYMTWYPDFSGVKTITDGELAAISIGGNVTSKPGAKMVKITTDPKVYAIAANGTLRWVTTESIASCLYGSSWGSMINDVPDPFFVNYTVGASITDCTQYSPSAATAGAQSINVDKGLAGATTGGNLQVSLASDTPATSTVANGASANFTKITLAAGAQAVKVKQVYVTRAGLSSNDNVNNIKVINSIGATIGDVGSLGSNSKALITFVPTLEIAANTSVSYWLRAGINGAPAGNTVALGIAVNTDVVLEAGTVTGAFPVMGNYMSVVVLTDLGGVEVGPQGAGVDSQPDVGTKRVLVSEFKISSIAVAGQSDNLTVESLSAIESGSANTSDSANIELYSLTEGRTLGTVSAWDANSRATWGNLGVVIPKGANHIFQVYLDVIGGSGQTIDVDITDGSDALVTVKGNTYGFYLTPAIAVGWDGQGMAGVLGQTVGVGILNVSKSASSPATGNITQATEQAITTWDFEVRGESAKITQTLVTLTLGGGLAVADLTNAKLVDENGNVVGGPRTLRNDGVGVAVSAGGCGKVAVCAVFTETNIVATGTHKFTLKIDVLSTAPNNGTLRADISAPGTVLLAPNEIQAIGINTKDNMKVSSAAANGNLQTILGAALNVTTLTQPAARLVAAGTQQFVWASASLDATNSGEDIRVSAVSVRDTIAEVGAGKAVNANDLTNMAIWADLTSASSSRGDAYETKVSNTVQPANSIVIPTDTAITLSQTITVAKGTFVKIAVVADLSSLGDPADTHTLKALSVNSSGKSTGNPPTVAYAGNGQTMTISGAGTLTMSIDASSPSAQILVSGQQKVAVGILKLAASNVENQDLDSVTLTDAGVGGVVNGAVSGNWYLYSNVRSDGGSTADPVAIAPGGASVNFQLADNTVTIPANGSIILTVKSDVAPVDGTTVQNLDTLQVQTYVTQSTGKSSGAIIIAGPLVAGNRVITGISVASPTTVTTFAAHNLTSGDVVTITGSDSVPSIDGAYVATVTGAATFTIPVNVTVVGTTGAFVGATPLAATIHTAMASRPYFSLNSGSPAGALVPGLVTLLGIFNVQADSADDITWDGVAVPGTNVNNLVVNLSDASACVNTMDLKDGEGNVLDALIAPVGAAPTFTTTFVFGTSDFVVTKGATKKLYVYGDTTGCTVSGDTVQIYFTSGDTLDWSINYDGGSYNLANVIFRGNLYANALVKG